MVRVLHVVECAQGGVPLFVRRVSEGLREEFEFGIACPVSSELHARPPKGAAIHPLEIPHLISPVRDITAAANLLKIVRSGGYEIVHLNSSKAGLIGAIAKRRLAAKVIFRPAAFKSWSYSERSPLKIAAQLTERVICGSADVVVAISPDEAHQVREYGITDSQKIRVIQNGVPLDEFARPGKLRPDSIGIPDGALIVGTIGRLSDQKAPSDFVQAARIVAARIHNAHFVMVGDGPLEQDIRRQVANTGLAERVHILGWRSDAGEVLKLFDVFVLTSRYEGFPFVLLEAAAASKAVVCTAAPGVACFVRDGEDGRLAAVGDYEGIAQAVCELLENRAERVRLADAAFESIARPRQLEVMLGQWSTLYRSLLKDRILTLIGEPVDVR